MKTKLAALALLTAALTVSAVSAGAFEGPFRGRGCGMERGGPDRGLARLSEALGLTEEQKSRIQEIRAAEQQRMKSLKDELRENRRELRELAQAANFDEAAVRAVAAEQAKTQAELTVSRLKVRHQVQSVLTPEQRELAEKLRHQGKGRGHPGRGPKNGA